MSFERAICTDELFAALGLPEYLRDRIGDTLDNEIVFDRAGKIVLIPESYGHADYPDRGFKFFVQGESFAASQWIGHPGEKDRIELAFEAETDDEKCEAVAALFESAVRLIENDPNLPLPITWGKNRPRQVPRTPRTTKRVIEKLNQFCIDLSEIDSSEADPSMLADFEELTIQSVISVTLMPEEIESLRKHIKQFGWGGMTPAARELMSKVFVRLGES